MTDHRYRLDYDYAVADDPPRLMRLNPGAQSDEPVAAFRDKQAADNFRRWLARINEAARRDDL